MKTYINDNLWHHIAVVRSSSSVLFYKDGYLQSTTTGWITGA